MSDTKYLQLLLMLMNSITQKDLDNNNELLCAFRKCQNQLGFNPHKNKINIANHIDKKSEYYFAMLNPEE